MTETVRFADVHAPVPDLDALTATAAEVTGVLHAAGAGLDECLAAVRDWDAVRRRVDTHAALVGLRFSQDTTDPDRRADREAWDLASPRWTGLRVQVQRALLAHPRRPELERELGAQAFALWESETLAFDPSITDHLVTESGLVAGYTSLLAGAEVDFRGERLTLSALAGLAQHADREVRHGAARAQWDWFARHGDELDRVYDELVRVRTETAGLLGLDDFVELGYRRMCRVDYDRADVEGLRAAVREHVVPLATELRRRQADRLGLAAVAAWDEGVHDPAGSPAPGGGEGWMRARAREMFDRMGALGPFYRLMDEGGFLDLPARPGKAGGGFCTSFPTSGMPFVFANFTGTKADVDVFTHEMGHAFQVYTSRDQPISDYHWPTLESAEIHSMSLEFLTWPYMEGFFGDQADRYRAAHLADRVLFLPYGTAVDHFQHEVYAHPELTPAQRHEVWRELERTYLPWRDWGDLERPAAGAAWQRQRHVYAMPFYYIDYVLAEVCALQFWRRSQENPAAALADYLRLCAAGGSAPFRGLVASAGLRSPFDPGCVAEVVDAARTALTRS